MDMNREAHFCRHRSPGCRFEAIRVNDGLRNRGDMGGRFRILSIFYSKKPKNIDSAGNRLDFSSIRTGNEGVEPSSIATEGEFF